jgi:two-component system, NarL family, response regulator NreC
MNSTTIVLADDHHVVRQGLRALLESEPDFSLVGEAGDGLEAVRLAERLKPNVLIVDLMMPGINGLEVTRQVIDNALQTRVLVLSMHANDAYVLEALKNGATGYLLKNSAASDLVQAVRDVAAGHRHLSPSISERAIDLLVQKTQASTLDVYETLTTREREVLQLAAEGNPNAEIGDRLFISSRTVETHRANLMRKLGLENHTELVLFAVRRGIIQTGE